MSRQQFLDDLEKAVKRPKLPLTRGNYFSTDGHGGYTACPIGNLLLRLGFVTVDQLKEGGYVRVDLNLRHAREQNSTLRQLARHYGMRFVNIDKFVYAYDSKTVDGVFNHTKRNAQLKKISKEIIEKMRK